MKPKYRKRLVLSMLAAAAVFVLLMYGVSRGVAAVNVLLNTTELKGVTAENVLQGDGFTQLLSVVKQEDASRMFAMDSETVLRGDGKLVSVRLNFVNLVSEKTAESWLLVSNEKKTTLRRVETKNENMSYLDMRKVPMGTYYPGLSRIASVDLMKYLEAEAPVGSAGTYTFTDKFDNNLKPEYSLYIDGGLPCVWISEIGSRSLIEVSTILSSDCVPTVVTARAVNSEKSKGKRVVLNEPEERFVVLFQAAPYTR